MRTTYLAQEAYEEAFGLDMARQEAEASLFAAARDGGLCYTTPRRRAQGHQTWSQKGYSVTYIACIRTWS